MISLLGSLLGFGTGFMPKVLDFFQARQNMKHELLLQENKIKMAKELSALKIKEETVKSMTEQTKAVYQHDQQLSKANPSKFIAALSASVRPVITYCMFMIFCVVTISQVIVGIQEGDEPLKAIQAAWSEESMALFSCIISFWFANRLVNK